MNKIKNIFTIILFVIINLMLPIGVAIAGIGDGLWAWWKAIRQPSRAYKVFYSRVWEAS